MGANLGVSPDDLNAFYGRPTSAMVGYGGDAFSKGNKLSKALNFAGYLADIIGGVRQGGIFQGAANAATRYNQRQYMKALADQQEKAMQRDYARRGTLAQAYNRAKAPAGGENLPPLNDQELDYSSLNPEDFKMLQDWEGNQQTVGGLNDLDIGKNPHFGGLATPEIVRQVMMEREKRRGDVTDSNQAMRDVKGVYNQPLQGNMANALAESMPQDTLVGGVSKNDLYNGSPFAMAAPDVNAYNTAVNNQMDYTMDGRKVDETVRHNKETEKRIPAQNANDYAGASLKNRTNPNLRGGGGSSNPVTEFSKAFNMLDSQKNSIRKDLDRIRKQSPRLDRAQALEWNDKVRMLQQIESQQAQLQGLSPFGGDSQQNIQNAGSAFQQWRQGRK